MHPLGVLWVEPHSASGQRLLFSPLPIPKDRQTQGQEYVAATLSRTR